MNATTRISLDLDPGEPVTGSIRDTTGHEQRFTGWLEMHAVIERMRERAVHVVSAPRQDSAEERGE